MLIEARDIYGTQAIDIYPDIDRDTGVSFLQRSIRIVGGKMYFDGAEIDTDWIQECRAAFGRFMAAIDVATMMIGAEVNE